MDSVCRTSAALEMILRELRRWELRNTADKIESMGAWVEWDYDNESLLYVMENSEYSDVRVYGDGYAMLHLYECHDGRTVIYCPAINVACELVTEL
jgi:hypothetical protein